MSEERTKFYGINIVRDAGHTWVQTDDGAEIRLGTNPTIEAIDKAAEKLASWHKLTCWGR